MENVANRAGHPDSAHTHGTIEAIFGEYGADVRAAREAAFVRDIVQLPVGSRVADLCCGLGRRAMALAGLGYAVIGIDLSEELLSLAAQRGGKDAMTDVRWIRADIRSLSMHLNGTLDLVVCLFSELGYLQTEGEDELVLFETHRVLSDKGRLLVDLTNREGLIRRFQPRVWAEEGGRFRLHQRQFNPLSGRCEAEIFELTTDGIQSVDRISLRLYSLTEIARMLERTGFTVEAVWGDFDGSALDLDSPRMITLASKREM